MMKKAGCKMLYWNDVSDDYCHWENLLEQLGENGCDNFEQEVWDMARQYRELPHFGNIRQHLLLERLRQTIEGRFCFLPVEYRINAVDTHLYVNDQCVTTLSDFDRVLGAYCREHVITIIEEGYGDE